MPKKKCHCTTEEWPYIWEGAKSTSLLSAVSLCLVHKHNPVLPTLHSNNGLHLPNWLAVCQWNFCSSQSSVTSSSSGNLFWLCLSHQFTRLFILLCCLLRKIQLLPSPFFYKTILFSFSLLVSSAGHSVRLIVKKV